MEDQACAAPGTSPCEAELQELMEQIDILVSHKQLGWERKLRALETRLDLRDRELANAQTCLDQKGQEVGLLRQKLESLERCNLAMTRSYEGQLQALKAQFSRLTSSFENLRLHQPKPSRPRWRDTPPLGDESPLGLDSLSRKLEEFRAKSSDWDRRELLHQTHLLSLAAQQRLLSERCGRVQAPGCPARPDGERPSPEAAAPEAPGRPCAPEPARGGGERDELVIERLKAAVGEMAASRSRLQDENRRLLRELRTSRRQCQAMEAGLAEVKSELRSRDGLLRLVETERLQLHRALLTAGEPQGAPGRGRPEPRRPPPVGGPEGTGPEPAPEQPAQDDEPSQVSEARPPGAGVEDAHLRGMMGDLDLRHYLGADLADSALRSLEHENERLRGDLARLQASGAAAWAARPGGEEAGCCAWAGAETPGRGEHRPGQDLEPRGASTPPPPSPPPFPLLGDEDPLALPPADLAFPASLAAQHFLLEEERRARELERLLDAHIDELRRPSEPGGRALLHRGRLA